MLNLKLIKIDISSSSCNTIISLRVIRLFPLIYIFILIFFFLYSLLLSRNYYQRQSRVHDRANINPRGQLGANTKLVSE